MKGGALGKRPLPFPPTLRVSTVFHLCGYRVTAGVNDVNVDMTALADGEFTSRNNHLIFTDNFAIAAWAHMGASVLRARLNSPSLNWLARAQVWPVMRSATPTSPPRLMDLRNFPIGIPPNEEIAIEESGNLGAATEEETSFLWIYPVPDVKNPQRMVQNIPRGLAQIVVRATAAVARVAGAWATGGTITFSENLKGGWYALVGAWCQSTLCRAFRLFFPRQPIIGGRRMRPGYLVHNAIGDVPSLEFPQDELGVWGIFHSFEPPTLEVEADAAGADTQELRLSLIYLGDSPTMPGGLL